MSTDPRVSTDRPNFRVVTVSSNKGGVGKTTFACNLAIYLRALREDMPVLLLTFDDQPMPDRMFAIDAEEPAESIISGFRKGSFKGAIRLGQYGVHYVSTSRHVADLKTEITSQADLWEVLKRTDWNGLVIIDTKSDFEILTQNAIAASDLSIVLVSDHASLAESEKVFELFDEWGRPHERARMLLSLVDLRIKFREGEESDILAVLLGEIRRMGYPLFDTFISRSPAIEALYTNPDERAHAILHRAPKSLIHKQMCHLADDVLASLDAMPPWAAAADSEVTSPSVVVPLQAPATREPGERTAADRRSQVRRIYKEEIAAFRGNDPAMLPLRARDISTTGLGIEPSCEFANGERVQIGLQPPAGEPPLLVWARVVADAANTARGMTFEPAGPLTRRRLVRLTEQLGVASSQWHSVSTEPREASEETRESEYPEAVVLAEGAAEADHADAIIVEDGVAEYGSAIEIAEAVVVVDDTADVVADVVVGEVVGEVVDADLVGDLVSYATGDEVDIEADVVVDLQDASTAVYPAAIVIPEEIGANAAELELAEAVILPDVPPSMVDTTPEEVDPPEVTGSNGDPVLYIDGISTGEDPQSHVELPSEEHQASAERRGGSRGGIDVVEAAATVEPIAKPKPATRQPTAASRSGRLRKVGLAVSAVLLLAGIAIWQINVQRSQTSAEPATASQALSDVATGPSADGVVGDSAGFEQWRDQTADALLSSLDGSDSNEYLDAIRWLSELEPDKTIDVLIGHLAVAEAWEEPGEASRRRALAASALGMLADPRAESALRKALSSDDPDLRVAAAKGLQQIRLQEQADELVVVELP